MKTIYSFLVFLILGSVTMSSAMERFDIITTQELSTLMEQREVGEKHFLLVNTLDELIFKHHTIPGSINIPWSRANELARERLGDDPDRLIITYCMGYR